MARIPKRLPRDVNARAVAIARILIEDDQATATDERSLDMITKNKTRASLGGRARAANIAPARRRAIAAKAAAGRWKKSRA